MTSELPSYRQARKGFDMELTFNNIQDSEFEAVSELIMNMYSQHLARYYTEKGDALFRASASADGLKNRKKKGTEIVIVKEGDELVGLLEFDRAELHQFFIVDEFRGRGYGRMAINWLKKHYRDNKLGDSVVVNASPNAYLAFEKMGFEPIAEEVSSDVLVSKKMQLKTA
ncbi:GNAT family N-acetyltransferase [bacterium]|nr:GNAT family N-acetyltransferase [bacterium]